MSQRSFPIPRSGPESQTPAFLQHRQARFSKNLIHIPERDVGPKKVKKTLATQRSISADSGLFLYFCLLPGLAGDAQSFAVISRPPKTPGSINGVRRTGSASCMAPSFSEWPLGSGTYALYPRARPRWAPGRRFMASSQGRCKVLSSSWAIPLAGS
jgi:hypothetical protein